MRSLFIYILFGFLMVIIQSRPQSDENNEGQEEIEYEGDNGTPDQESIEGSHFRDEEPASQEVEQDRRLLDLNRNTYLQKNVAEDEAVRTKLDIADDKPTRTREIRNDRFDSNVNEDFQGYKARRSNIYMDSNDPNVHLETAKHVSRDANNNYKSNRMHNYQILNNKRTVDTKPVPTEEGELLFVSNREQISKIDKTDYNIEPYELNQRPSSYHTQQYYNDMHPEVRPLLNINTRNNDRVYYSRDRRGINKSNLKESEGDSDNNSVVTSNESLVKTENENEEMAIKRHIKKLSENELEELFNSLSEEKRALLKKIMDDTDVPENSDIINKREITKKAGAVEINGYVDLSQSESSKIQGGASSIDIPTEYSSQDSSLLEQATKQSESTILSNSKQESSSGTKMELKSCNEDVVKSDISVDDFVPNDGASKNQAKEALSEQGTVKTDKKRETNLEDVSTASFENPEQLSDENAKQSMSVVGYFSTQDEDLSPFLEDDQSRFYDASKMYKRDLEKQSELDKKLKSLEESFPNPNSYDDPSSYSGPLIRVKRKNVEKNMKKRAAAILPDSKVGFFSYKDSDDADNDESSEFDDDGFYDPTPNFVSKENNKNVDTNSQQAGGEGVNCVLNTVDHGKSPNADTSSGAISLGSDTDNVLSGVEGVDENLMFISGNRNRRKTDGNLSEDIDETNHIHSPYGKTSDDSVKETSNNNNLNMPNYQESDSFGGLPHNYEGDLGRYKRIRRVKQSHVSENGEVPGNT